MNLFSLITLWLALGASRVIAENGWPVFCSDINTADGEGSMTISEFAQFQSAGACKDTCGGHAFAITQSSYCWCSDYTPNAQLSNDKCDTSCPGYPSDKCGSLKNGYFSYFQIAAAKGTATKGSPSTASTTTSNPSKAPSSTSTSTLSPTSTEGGSSASNPSTTSSTSTSVPTSGVHSDQGNAQGHNSESSSDQFFQSPEKVAGTFVAVGILLILLIGSAIYAFWRRKKNYKNSRLIFSSFLGPENSTQMTESKVGSAESSESRGLLSFFKKRRSNSNGLAFDSEDSLNGKPSLTEQSFINPAWPPPSMGGGPDGATSLYHRGGEEEIPVDQRVNRQKILNRMNSSQSKTSLRDDEDYSRNIFRVTNPD